MVGVYSQIPEEAEANASAFARLTTAWSLSPSQVFAGAMVACDLAALALAILGLHLAILLFAPLGLFGDAASLAAFEHYWSRAALFGLALLGIFATFGVYDASRWEVEELRGVFSGVFWMGALDIVTRAQAGGDALSVPVLFWTAAMWGGFGAAALGLRMTLRARPWFREVITSPAILIGDRFEPAEFAKAFARSKDGPVNVVGAIRMDEIAAHGVDALRRRSRTLMMMAGARASAVKFIVAPGGDTDRARLPAVTSALDASGYAYSVVLDQAGAAADGLQVRKLIGSDMALVETPARAPGAVELFCKRAVDIIGSAALILLLAPLLGGLWALLAREDGGVLFRQLRVGKDGRRFWCLKFRTMRPDAQERLQELLDSDPEARAEWETHQKLLNDPRITKVGAFLRATSLDELPQIFNVLKGDMSLVGPRPIIAPEIEGYPGDRRYYESDAFAYYAQCRPGVTGLWQVSDRARSAHSERVRLDSWYVRNWSFWLDIVIIMRTFAAVFGRTGS